MRAARAIGAAEVEWNNPRWRDASAESGDAMANADPGQDFEAWFAALRTIIARPWSMMVLTLVLLPHERWMVVEAAKRLEAEGWGPKREDFGNSILITLERYFDDELVQCRIRLAVAI